MLTNASFHPFWSNWSKHTHFRCPSRNDRNSEGMLPELKRELPFISDPVGRVRKWSRAKDAQEKTKKVASGCFAKLCPWTPPGQPKTQQFQNDRALLSLYSRSKKQVRGGQSSWSDGSQTLTLNTCHKKTFPLIMHTFLVLYHFTWWSTQKCTTHTVIVSWTRNGSLWICLFLLQNWIF